MCILAVCTCMYAYRYEQKAVFAVVIPCIDYLRECLTKHGLEVATCDNSTLCTLNETITMVSQTGMCFYIHTYLLPIPCLLRMYIYTYVCFDGVSIIMVDCVNT